MTPIRYTAAAMVLLLSAGIAGAEDEPGHSPSVDGVSAPVVYESLMLVLTHKKGVAALIFAEDIKDGVKYRYRYRPNEGKEESGTGELFEKYRRPWRGRRRSW